MPHDSEPASSQSTAQSVALARRVAAAVIASAAVWWLVAAGSALLWWVLGSALLVAVLGAGRNRVVIPGSLLSLVASLLLVAGLFHPSGNDHMFGLVYVGIVVVGWPIIAAVWSLVARSQFAERADWQRTLVAFGACFVGTAIAPAALIGTMAS